MLQTFDIIFYLNKCLKHQFSHKILIIILVIDTIYEMYFCLNFPYIFNAKILNL